MRSACLGAVIGGLVAFIFGFIRMSLLVSELSASILSDSEAWWGEWFIPVGIVALPAILIGAIAGAISGALFNGCKFDRQLGSQSP